MKLEIAKIRIDGDTQPRVSLNQEVIGEYAEAVMLGEAFPPVIVFHDGRDYWLADGFHRYLAHKRAALTEIEAEVHVGALREALLYSVGANDKHGLRRTNEDKRRAVLILLNDPEWSEWSDAEIARRANVSAATVHRIKKSLQLEAKPDRKYTDKRGVERTMNTANIGKKEMPKIDIAEVPEKEDPVAEMAAELTAMAEENTKLKEMLAVEAMDVPEEIKLDVTEQLEQYKHRIRVLETEVEAIRRSRDTLQNENVELLKQVHYWRKRCQKHEQKAA
jgi:hypothetical protein